MVLPSAQIRLITTGSVRARDGFGFMVAKNIAAFNS